MGEVVFYEREIKVIDEPKIKFDEPIISDVNLENMTPSSPHYTDVMYSAENGVNGLTAPELIKISEPTFYYLKGDKWYPNIEQIEGEYIYDYRLLDTQKEVTGPSGNSTEENYCAQIMVMGSIPKYNDGFDYQHYYDTQIGAGRPGWYMLEAVKKHEAVHKPKLLDAFYNDIKDSLLSLIEKRLIYIDQPQKDFSEIDNGNFIFVDLKLEEIASLITEIWIVQHLARSKSDHDSGGAAEQAEYSVINPMIEQICVHAHSNNWDACYPDVCNEPMPYGQEIPYIIDVTNPENLIHYDLTNSPSISIGERNEIKLLFYMQNGMIIGENVVWSYTYDGGEVSGSKEMVFRKKQLKETPEIVTLTYGYDQFIFDITH